MIYSPQRNFCFIHVPKTGGTSIEYAYSKIIAFGDIILDGSSSVMSQAYLEGLDLGRHAAAAQIADAVGRSQFQDMFSAAVLRDPVERMVSYYRWIHSFEHQGPLEKNLKGVTDFEKFVDIAIDHLAAQSDFIFGPQYSEPLVQFLIPYPYLVEGWSTICNILKITSHLPHLNKSAVQWGVEVEKVTSLILARYGNDQKVYSNLLAQWNLSHGQVE